MRKWLLTLLLVLVAAFAYKENEGAFDTLPEDMMEFLAPTPTLHKNRQPLPVVNNTADAPLATPIATPLTVAVAPVTNEPAVAAPPTLAVSETMGGTSSEMTPEPWQSSDQIQGTGRVTRILPDDNQGSRHQRFILTLPTGRTLLVAHNIDLAPRINSLRAGDTVAFYGEYIWNDKGGILHWTHHDPKGRHAGGWLKHNDELYQ